MLWFIPLARPWLPPLFLTIVMKFGGRDANTRRRSQVDGDECIIFLFAVFFFFSWLPLPLLAGWRAAQFHRVRFRGLLNCVVCIEHALCTLNG